MTNTTHPRRGAPCRVGEARAEPISVRLSPAYIERLRELARESGETVSQALRRLVEAALRP